MPYDHRANDAIAGLTGWPPDDCSAVIAFKNPPIAALRFEAAAQAIANTADRNTAKAVLAQASRAME